MSNVEVSEGRDARNRFLPGNKHGAAGRPKGARDKHTRNFLEAMSNDFEAHGAEVIRKVREEQPAVWLKIAFDMLPKHAELDVSLSIDPVEFAARFRTAMELLGNEPELPKPRRQLRIINADRSR